MSDGGQQGEVAKAPLLKAICQIVPEFQVCHKTVYSHFNVADGHLWKGVCCLAYEFLKWVVFIFIRFVAFHCVG